MGDCINIMVSENYQILFESNLRDRVTPCLGWVFLVVYPFTGPCLETTMSKDPAFLFYSSDFISDIMFMTDSQVGKYIRLWCAQHQHGHLSRNHMLNICKRYDKVVFDKFEQDNQGLFYNPVLEDAVVKRKNYSESRRNNRLGAKKPKTSETYDNHMENRTENRNPLVPTLSNSEADRFLGGVEVGR